MQASFTPAWLGILRTEPPFSLESYFTRAPYNMASITYNMYRNLPARKVCTSRLLRKKGQLDQHVDLEIMLGSRLLTRVLILLRYTLIVGRLCVPPLLSDEMEAQLKMVSRWT